MDDSQFDDLVRALANPSRRTILRRLASSALGGILVPVLADNATEAHDLLAKCKKLQGDKKKKCLKKAKKHNATHTTPSPPGGGGDGSQQGDPDPCAGVQCPDEPPCGRNGTCAGGVCQRYGGGTPCGPGSCISGFPSLRDFHICDGAGTCVKQTESCGAYRCREDTCPGSCTIDDHCMSYAYCQGGACLPRRTNGQTCDRGRQCEWGFCVDGVCCQSACAAPPNARRSCATGVCQITCLDGWDDCNGDMSDGCEQPLAGDVANCGACDLHCNDVCDGAPATCPAGECLCSSRF
jgi:hypothetical protein